MIIGYVIRFWWRHMFVRKTELQRKEVTFNVVSPADSNRCCVPACLLYCITFYMPLSFCIMTKKHRVCNCLGMCVFVLQRADGLWTIVFWPSCRLTGRRAACSELMGNPSDCHASSHILTTNTWRPRPKCSSYRSAANQTHRLT